MLRSLFFCLICALLSTNASLGQCVFINELMINGPSGCDGNCNPNTEEWVELYNACNTAVDVSCWVMTDGDFTVTFPAGTIISPNGFFVIGSMNSGGTVNLDLGNCGCAAGSMIGTYTNNNEQLILTDASGVVQDAVYWGSGQFPVSIISQATGICNALTITYTSPNGDFEFIGPNGGGNGATLARSCDGGNTWIEVIAGSTTMGSTNGGSAPAVNFSASDTIICVGSCISFSDLSAGGVSNWSWLFQGASPAISASQNPFGICYSTSGNYDVTLTVINACGSASLTKPLFIDVATAFVPAITPAGPVDLCYGETVMLSVSGAGAVQWFLNGTAITGATNQEHDAAVSGVYTASVANGSCGGNSNSVIVNIETNTNITIAASGSTVLCNGDSVILNAGAGFATYQWMLNGNAVAGAASTQLTATTAGDYSVQVSNSIGCTAASNSINVTSTIASDPIIQSSNGSFSFCSYQSFVLTVETGYSAWQWYYNNAPISGATNPALSVTQAGTYSVAVLTANGCADTSQHILVEMFAPPSPTITPFDTTVCEGSMVTIASTASFDSYQWIDNGSVIGGANSNAFITNTQGSFALAVTDANGCIGISNTTDINIADADVDIAIDLSMCGSATLAVPDLFVAYSWSSGETNATITTTNAGNYAITTIDQFGCSTTNSVNVLPIGCDETGWWAPNAFTPNDDGINDVFRILSATPLADLNLRVFNRWGQLVYESNDQNKGWNGRFKNQDCPIDSYVWLLRAAVPRDDGSLKTIAASGNVTLLR